MCQLEESVACYVYIREVQDKVQSLQQQLAGTQAELGSLQQQYSLGEKRLVRASKLISALGDEAGRWGQAADALLTRLNLLVGELLLRSLFDGQCIFVMVQNSKGDATSTVSFVSMLFSYQGMLCRGVHSHVYCISCRCICDSAYGFDVNCCNCDCIAAVPGKLQTPLITASTSLLIGFFSTVKC